MPSIPTNPRMRTLVVVETAGKRHVFELDAEATETWEHPAYNAPHTFGPHRLALGGAVMRHIVYDRQAGDDLLKEQEAICEAKGQIEGGRDGN